MRNSKLFKVFGGIILEALTSTGGLSITKATEKKNMNTNKIKNLEKDLNPEIYRKIRTVISASGKESIPSSPNRLFPSDFNCLDEMAELAAENSMYGFGRQVFKDIEEKINWMDEDKIARIFGLEKPEIPVQQRLNPSVVKTNTGSLATTKMDIDSFNSLERVEDMFKAIRDIEIWEELPNDIVKKALHLESLAAVYGKKLTRSGEFLQRLLAAEAHIIDNERDSAHGLILYERELIYTPEQVEEFRAKFDELYARYSDVQGQLSGLKKLIKDAVSKVSMKRIQEDAVKLAKYRKERENYNIQLEEYTTKVDIIRKELLEELKALKVNA